MESENTIKKGFARLAFIGMASLPFSAATADCFDQAAAYQRVNAGVLRAIAIKETSKCRSIVTRNRNGSIDVGCMGINSVHFPELAKHGVYPDDLMDKCKNIYVAAWHYRKKVNKYGNNWKAVGAYHNEIPSIRDRYAHQVYQIWVKYGLHRY